VADWVCVNGGWVPPSQTVTCPGNPPLPGWICVNGGWVPPAQTSTCTTVKPVANWVCVNGGWRPPGAPDDIPDPDTPYFFAPPLEGAVRPILTRP
jgi:hypothetical protein